MNKEFMFLSDGKVVVTDDTGHITIREGETLTETELLLENKLEFLEKEILKKRKDLKENEKVVLLSKWMNRISPLLALFIITIMSLCGGLFVPGDAFINALIYGVSAFLYSSIACAIELIYFGVIGPLYKKKVLEAKEELENADDLKEELEKELSSIREKALVEDQVLSINEPVSLVEKTMEKEAEVREILYKHDIETLNSGELQLVRRKK